MSAVTEDATWSIWFYKPGEWLGWPIYFGNAEGCARTLLIGTKWTGCIVFGLWRMRYDPECPECVDRRPTSSACDHDWTNRGSGDFAWRECWLCGEQTPYETREDA